MNLRSFAAKIIDSVTSGRSLSDLLDAKLTSIPEQRDRALVQAICFGVCRYYDQLDFVLSELLDKPMKAKDADVHSLLLVGLYQLMHMRIPEHAAVAETVNGVKSLKKTWARGFINGVLREYIRQKDVLAEKIEQDEEAKYAHPLWLIRKIKQAYPDNWQSVLTANNAHPPLSLRVNTAKTTRADYLNRMAGELIQETAAGIMVDPVPVESLPGFADGMVYVQDGAAQLAAEYLDVADGQRILDACAAPGGKLTHILELAPKAQVVAIEKESGRIQAIKDNLKRMQQKAEIICADAAEWRADQPFDRILCDAPCSAIGVIRRHPDIKLLRQVTDIKPLVELQQAILRALWQQLKPGGKLLYATCSILPEENVEQIKRFLVEHDDAVLEALPNQAGIGRQILPGDDEMDGFYYALLSRKA